MTAIKLVNYRNFAPRVHYNDSNSSQAVIAWCFSVLFQRQEANLTLDGGATGFPSPYPYRYSATPALSSIFHFLYQYHRIIGSND